jgi:GntR family transcriptional regulator/MocR family aminotransferase
MPKSAAVPINHDLALDHASPTPLYRQLYERLRRAILSGQLHAGDRLPSTRTLASQLGVSRNVVCLACDQLIAEGYIASKVGRGMHVAQVIPEALLTVPTAAHAPAAPAGLTTHPAASRGGARLAQPVVHADSTVPPDHGSRPICAFRAGVPALGAFPYQLWAQIVARHARHTLPHRSDYQETAGYRPLREAIAAHIGITRGVQCTADQLVIVTGAQSALDLAARVVLDPGDRVWMEDPGYHGARAALGAAGAQLVPVPITAAGLDVAAGTGRAPEARLAYVTPSHQLPLGVTMSFAQRLALLEWAYQAQAWILEDDYDSEYRFSGRPLEALYGLDRGNRVIYLGTFSKTLFPALRLGFLVAPPDLVDAFVAAYRSVGRHAPILEQLALAEFITAGHFMRHLRRMRTLYAERSAALIDALTHELGDLLVVQRPEGGMQLVGWLPPGCDDRVAAAHAAAHDVDVVPVSLFSLEPQPRGGLVLGYAAVDVQELRAGAQRLARALHSLPRS